MKKILALLALAGAAGLAFAQAYPGKPIRLIVGQTQPQVDAGSVLLPQIKGGKLEK